ncbi:DUF937 domain-containing protein [Lutimonas sp.]|uniref:DUF937 domain-containing protein n=1 Tax=Lutimonas sp. TaxID=1872403 RepID=UPI003D9BF07C
MSGILDLLNSEMGQELANSAGKQLGIDAKSASGALSTAMPLLLGALQNNSSSAEGSAQLLGALNSPVHSGGGRMDDMSSILGGDSIDQDVMDDGANILGHIFGGQENNAANALSKSSGIDMGSAMNILKVAAPFIMSYLGKQTKNSNVSDAGGLTDMLGGLLGGQGGDMASMASLIQGFDGNNSSVDDIASMLGGGSKSSGSLGGLLNDFLK